MLDSSRLVSTSHLRSSATECANAQYARNSPSKHIFNRICVKMIVKYLYLHIYKPYEERREQKMP